MTCTCCGGNEIPFTLEIMERIYNPRISQADVDLMGQITKLKRRVAELEEQFEGDGLSAEEKI